MEEAERKKLEQEEIEASLDTRDPEARAPYQYHPLVFRLSDGSRRMRRGAVPRKRLQLLERHRIVPSSSGTYTHSLSATISISGIKVPLYKVYGERGHDEAESSGEAVAKEVAE